MAAVVTVYVFRSNKTCCVAQHSGTTTPVKYLCVKKESKDKRQLYTDPIHSHQTNNIKQRNHFQPWLLRGKGCHSKSINKGQRLQKCNFIGKKRIKKEKKLHKSNYTSQKRDSLKTSYNRDALRKGFKTIHPAQTQDIFSLFSHP